MTLSGNPIDFLWVFLGGILLSLTPCIYPLLPITIAYIGANSTDSKIKGFSLSLVYVTGVSITYTILGLAAVLTGSLFGEFSSLPSVRIIVGLIIIFFGFSLWRSRGISLPGVKLPLIKKSGIYLSCFLLGLISGLIVSPCITPALGSILIFVATKRNFIYGALLLISFAYGMGLLLILAGTFSSILTALPKSGYWMVVIKKICAVILIVVGVYFVVLGAASLAYAQDSEVQAGRLDFALSDLDGNNITLSEFKNKKSVILFFWTTGCHFCLAEFPRLNQMQSTFAAEDIELLAINVLESKLMVRRVLKRNPLDFKVLLDSDGMAAYTYGLIGVPTYVLINKRSEIVFISNYFPNDAYKRLLTEG